MSSGELTCLQKNPTRFETTSGVFMTAVFLLPRQRWTMSNLQLKQSFISPLPRPLLQHKGNVQIYITHCTAALHLTLSTWLSPIVSSLHMDKHRYETAVIPLPWSERPFPQASFWVVSEFHSPAREK